MVCKLHKSLYGLKQASRQWNAKLTASILRYGFKQSMSDYSLYTMKKEDGSFTALLVYVDDIIVGSTSIKASDDVKGYLKSQFKIKDLRNVKYFLGLEIDQSTKGISICQRKYVLDVLENQGLLRCKPMSTPIDYNHKLSKAEEEEQLTNPTSYRQLIGKLLYLTFTRPEISYAVQVLSQFMDKPGRQHLIAAHRVLKYQKGSPGQGILMKVGTKPIISAYSDSDWARCLETRRSITGYCILVGESLISWKSKKQQVVARSSTEVEYRSIATTCYEGIWLKFLLTDLDAKHDESVNLYCDNQSTLNIYNQFSVP
ncbi:uncharacterized protein LOC110428069 [Herrania umbratica]|uniref:Uncharacterized protein LOC110428069 n=1 Tax=Herrania umbratica TaxID=108875 RepID=A0A6J1BJG8_9ROSI|nr:uncharacterized protein LOC110428069 [Herrania umbratica]